MRYNQTVILKDGTRCLLRNAEKEDARELLRVFNLTHGQTENLRTYPEENTFTVQMEQEFVAGQAESENAVELCAFVDGVLVGSAGISPVGSKCKERHRADFGIAIDRAYWGRGIGKALTAACMECARKAGYLQVELTVVGTNQSAVTLYRKAGFVEFGRNPKGFRTRDGAWQELILMRMELPEHAE